MADWKKLVLLEGSLCLLAADVRAAALEAVQSETAQSPMPLEIPIAPVASATQAFVAWPKTTAPASAARRRNQP